MIDRGLATTILIIKKNDFVGKDTIFLRDWCNTQSVEHEPTCPGSPYLLHEIIKEI